MTEPERRYRQASGARFSHCACLGYLDGDRSAVVLVRETPGAPTPLELGVRCVVPTLLTGLWRADDGTVFTCDRDGFVRWSPDPWHDEGWQQQHLDLTFHGVAGDSARHVWAWGVRPSDGSSLLRRYDGRDWKAVGAPGFPIAAVAVGRHVWCGGAAGQLARFEGSGWSVLQLADGVDLVAVGESAHGLLVACADGRILAVPDGDGPVHELGQLPVRPWAIGWWRGAVWVGAGADGVWRLVDGRAEQLRSDRPCRSIDTRHELVLGCDDVISGSPDGARFPATGRGFLSGR